MIGNAVPSQPSTILALTTHNNEIIAAGSFVDPAVPQKRSIARWNGSTWLPVGGGIGGTIYALAVYQGQLIAGGSVLGDRGDEARRHQEALGPLG